MADAAGAKTVAVIPCDCGTHDIGDTARVQLSAILTFIKAADPKSITHIFLVMNDEESAAVYEEYFERIFK
jgi:O-acetyl-ADP-ribose deacetylase (regulator of RNase III)